MSSYSGGRSNRIPVDSVAFSTKPFMIKSEDILDEKYLTEEEKTKKVKRNELEEKEIELKNYELQLNEKQTRLENQYEVFESEKKSFLTRLRQEQEEFERQKRQDYYDMREFMWESALSLAEEMINQKIRNGDFLITDLFEGMIKRLPIAFEELTITANPVTIEMIKKENPKGNWILTNIQWKYDYNMGIGEFIVEEENEYYDVRFASIFNEIKKQITEVNLEVRNGVKND